MNDDTTIIIITKNNYDIIQDTYKTIKEYMNKYRNIQKTIIIDNNSMDGTGDYLRSIHDDQFTILSTETDRPEKSLFLKAFYEIRTPNAIILEAELYTRLHQIQRQIKKLRRTDLLLINRFHKKSKTKFKSDQEELRVKFKNYILKIFSGINREDLTNINKAFKKNKIENLLKRIKSKNLFWIELIKKCEKSRVKISETKTHYIQERKQEHDKILYWMRIFKELIRIKRI